MKWNRFDLEKASISPAAADALNQSFERALITGHDAVSVSLDESGFSVKPVSIWLTEAENVARLEALGYLKQRSDVAGKPVRQED